MTELNCTIDARALLAAVAAAGLVIERRNSAPILSNVLLQVTPCGGRLAVTGTDLDIISRESVALAMPATPGAAVTVSAVALAGILKKMPAGQLAALQASPEGLAIVGGRERFKVATLRSRDYPAPAIAAPRLAFSVPGAELARDLALLLPFMSTEESRYYLNGIHVTAGRDDDGRPAIIWQATDGANIVRLVRPLPAGAALLARIAGGTNQADGRSAG